MCKVTLCVTNSHWVLEFFFISLWKIPLSQKIYTSTATDTSDKYEVWGGPFGLDFCCPVRWWHPPPWSCGANLIINGASALACVSVLAFASALARGYYWCDRGLIIAYYEIGMRWCGLACCTIRWPNSTILGHHVIVSNMFYIWYAPSMFSSLTQFPTILKSCNNDDGAWAEDSIN